MKYSEFLQNLDNRLQNYFDLHKEYINCHVGCSYCCEKGDYPISTLELEYLMQGFLELDIKTRKKVQNNVLKIKKGGKCPFLLDKKCSVYQYRPIICRVHGLAYLINSTTVKLPYCVNDGKNYAEKYSDGEITINPIAENLDTTNILKDLDFGEIRNLFDWINQKQN